VKHGNNPVRPPDVVGAATNGPTHGLTGLLALPTSDPLMVTAVAAPGAPRAAACWTAAADTFHVKDPALLPDAERL